MSIDRQALMQRLAGLGIPTDTVEHAPMFTVEETAELRHRIPGAHTKNLFLTDAAGRMALVVAKDDTRVDLTALAKRLAAGRFSFGKKELLEAVLGVLPGSVTPLALINPSAAGITVVIDKALMDFAEVNCHPLENTATTRLATQDLLRFVRACGHEPMILSLG